jgi:hypothetical protein
MDWTPPERPDWLARFNAEADAFDVETLVPLQADELIDTATRSLGITDFGDDQWREAFQVLITAINEEAELNFFGRLFTRAELLQALKVRLQIQETYRKHPEIDDEEIREPVFITGLSRSGTSILFERLAEDPQLGPLLSWEIVEPCPPPEAASYETDPRIERTDKFLTLYNRLAPQFRAMHEMGARIPNECSEAFIYSFHTENLPARVNVPSYLAWLKSHGNWRYMYDYHKRFLKLLQWKNPRRHWLLKAPPHLWHLDELFQAFPDARVLYTHRDPLRANASNTNLLATLFWMRSDKPFETRSFERLLAPEVMADALDSIVGQFEAGDIPIERVINVMYKDLVERPWEAIDAIYRQTGLELSTEAERRIRAFIASKQQDKFGRHQYRTVQDHEERQLRELFTRYQHYFKVPMEVE